MMKRCPFCAEEIMEEAIKCRFCGSWLAQGGAPAGADVAPVAVISQPAQGAPHVMAVPPQNAVGIAVQPAPIPKELGVDGSPVIYTGSPTWRAQFGRHALAVLAGSSFLTLMIILRGLIGTPSLVPIWVGLAGLLGVAGYLLYLMFHRKSTHYRITERSIDIESGLLSRNIETMQMWKVRDIEYFQSFVDRVLNVSTVRVVAHDVTTPNVMLWGLPEDREIFRKFKNAVELSRQGRNVIGLIDDK